MICTTCNGKGYLPVYSQDDAYAKKLLEGVFNKKSPPIKPKYEAECPDCRGSGKC